MALACFAIAFTGVLPEPTSQSGGGGGKKIKQQFQSSSSPSTTWLAHVEPGVRGRVEKCIILPGFKTIFIALHEAGSRKKREEGQTKGSDGLSPEVSRLCCVHCVGGNGRRSCSTWRGCLGYC